MFDTINFIKTLLELCGDYNPEATDDRETYTLDIGQKVPILLYSKQKAEYPQIRIQPIIEENPIYVGRVGIYEDATQFLQRTGTSHTYLRRIRSTILVHSKDHIQSLEIRDKLLDRIHKFVYSQVVYTQNNEWEKVNNLYINTKYKKNMKVVSVLENGNRLKKVEDPTEVSGSWSIDNEKITVNPINSIDNIEVAQICNDGLYFHDGTLLRDRRFLNIKIAEITQKDLVEPKIYTWRIQLLTDYIDILKEKQSKPQGVNVEWLRKK